MSSEELETITNSITEKIGTENASLISDDLGLLITKNNETLTTLTNKDNEIKDLKSRNDKLVSANANLLQQIPMKKDNDNKELKQEEPKKFNFTSAFDDKGNFIER